MTENIKGTIPYDIKISNRQTILSRYRSGQKLTPNDIARAVGLSRQTVIKAIEYFVSKGILSPVGKGSSTAAGGRRPSTFELSRNICFVSVNAEDRVLRFTLFNLYSEPLYQIETAIPDDPSLDEFRSGYYSGAAKILEKLPEDYEIQGVSMTIRGLVDSRTKVLRGSPYYTSWPKDLPMEDLKDAFPGASLFVIDKPVRTFARYFLERNAEEYAGLRVLVMFSRHGMAGSTIDHGHIEMGTHAIIGEFSHVILNADSGMNGGNVLKMTLDQFKNDLPEEYLRSPLSKKQAVSLSDLFSASAGNDPFAAAVSAKTAELYAYLLRSINLTFDADRIILIGEFAEADTLFRDVLRKETDRFIFYPEDGKPEIIYDSTPLDEMLVSGSASNMLHAWYKDPSLYRDEA